MDKSISLIIPAEAEYIRIVRLALLGIATEAGYSFEDIEDMKLAVSEACNQAVLSATGNGMNGTLKVDYKVMDKSMRIRIKDRGVRSSRAAISPNAALPGEFGLLIMNTLMDQVHIRSSSQVTLSKLKSM